MGRAVNIRALTADDIPVVAAWIVTIPLWQRYRLTVEKLSAQLEAALSTDLLLTADADDAWAVALAWCVRRGAFGRSAYLKLLGVRPDHAGSGIGALLLDQLEASVSSADLFLLASDFNHGARRFYERQGYEQIGAIPGYVLPDVTELIYRKRLKR
jgi:ribosomal protein S18 acetylase RimI-like enzyme